MEPVTCACKHRSETLQLPKKPKSLKGKAPNLPSVILRTLQCVERAVIFGLEKAEYELEMSSRLSWKQSTVSAPNPKAKSSEPTLPLSRSPSIAPSQADLGYGPVLGVGKLAQGSQIVKTRFAMFEQTTNALYDHLYLIGLEGVGALRRLKKLLPELLLQFAMIVGNAVGDTLNDRFAALLCDVRR